MAEITAKMVKELREQTGAGMMDVKAALVEANGDMEEARTILRKKGLATASKKAGRITAEGMVTSVVEGNVGVLVEVNCETDFVARTEGFRNFAAEVANRTVHGVLHLARIADETGGFHAEMTVLVKPNGLLGRGYMAAIKPFRHLIVYPALFRSWERAWERRSAAPVSPAAPGTAPRRESSAAP